MLRARALIGAFVVIAVLLIAPFTGTTAARNTQEACEESPYGYRECVEAEREREEHEHQKMPAPPEEETNRPPNEPTDPLRAHIARAYPTAAKPFVSCPGNNRVSLPDRSEGIACEFRFVLRGATVKGVAVVAPETERWSSTAWSLLGFRAEPPQPRHWHRCTYHRPSRELPEPARLSASGTSCGEARYLATMIGSRAAGSDNLRLPHRFTEGENGTNTLGFVVSRFRCKGEVEVRQGHPNPYGHESARCHTRFGDKLTYVFNQGS